MRQRKVQSAKAPPCDPQCDLHSSHLCSSSTQWTRWCHHSASPALGLSELLTVTPSTSTPSKPDRKCKPKLQISSLTKIHTLIGMNKNQYPFPLYLVTQASFLDVPLTQSGLYNFQGTFWWWISVRAPRPEVCHQNQHILLLNHFDTRHFLMQDTQRVTTEGSWSVHALTPILLSLTAVKPSSRVSKS